MQFSAFNVQFRLSDKQLNIIDFSILGLTTLTFYGLYQIYLKRNKEKQKLKRFRYIYTVKECQELQIDKNDILIQGQIKNCCQCILLKPLNNCTKNHFYQLYGFSSLQITDPSTNAEIRGNWKYDRSLLNYTQLWEYKSLIKSFIYSSILERLERKTSNPYYILKGKLVKQQNQLAFEADQVSLNPTIFYQEINKNLLFLSIIMFLLTISATFLISILYKRMRKQLKRQRKQELFCKKEDQVLTESDLCITCMINVRNMLILPCYHLICCQECLNQLRVIKNACPICRTIISESKQLFIDNLY